MAELPILTEDELFADVKPSLDKKKINIITEDELFPKLPATDKLADLSGRELDTKGVSETLSNIANNFAINTPIGRGAKQAYDYLPDLRENKPPTTLTDRALVKSLAVRPDEQVLALKKLGYDAELKGSSVYVNGKQLDPSTVLSLQELLSETIENINLPIEAAGSTGVVTAGLSSGGMGLVRENLKEKTFDIPPNLEDVATEGAFGALGQGVATGLGGLIKGSVKGTKSAKNLAKKGYNIADEYVDEKGVVTKIDEITTTFLDDITGREADAKALGALPKMLKVFNNKPITVNIQRLRELSPQFDKITKGYSVKNKRDAMIGLLNKTTDDLSNLYNQYGDSIKVNVDDIFSSDQYQKMLNILANKQTEDSVANTINAVRQRNAMHIAKMVLPESQYASLTRGGEEVLDQFGNKITSDFYPNMPVKELEAKLAQYPIELDDLWATKKFLDDEAGWGSRIPDKSRFEVGTFRQLANSVREATANAIQKSGIDNEAKSQFALNNEIIHNLIPVADMFDTYAGGKVGKLNMTRLMWSKIGSPLRRTLEFGGRLVGTDTGRNIIGGSLGKIKNLSKMALPEFAEGEIPNILKSVGYAGKLGRIGLSKADARNIIDQGAEIPVEEGAEIVQGELPAQSIPQEFESPTPEITADDITKLITKEVTTPKLPRSPELINQNPVYLDALGDALTPDTFNLLQDAVSSKDPMKLRAVMPMILSEAPDYFEPSVTGNRSEMMIGNHYVITDPLEAETYRQRILSMADLEEIDSEFAAEQLSALNNPRDMRVFPLPGQNFEKPQVKQESKGSQLQELQNKLGEIGERRSYDY